jgi:D-3-phosphoglycerate dehydrogenase
LAVDLFPVDKPPHVESLWPVERLPEMLPQVDILSLHAPLNASTRNMIDAAAIAQMKPGSLLCNMARGPLVVHDDMVAALQSGHLAGAIMDVTEPEPLPPSSPLWEMPNVIITPHVGGQAAWRIDAMTNLFARNLLRWQKRLPLINYLSDKHLGFPIRGGVAPLWGEPCEP